MLKELLRAFFLIFIAEMGDKTQIIAMTFATQYKVKEVLFGVLIGVFLNHGIAIILGKYLSKVVPLDLVQIMAGVLFVIFGILALRVEEEEESGYSKRNFSPIITVALAFFIGELGDKTQLTAMTLAAEGNYPIFILFGTTLGMLGTSGLGIFVGSRIGEKIPDILIKIISSSVFLIFGTLKLFQVLPKEYLTDLNIITYFVILSAIIFISIKKLIYLRKSGQKSAMREVAATLYTQTKELKKAVDDICLGEETCGMCMGEKCIIGFTKEILEKAKKEECYYLDGDVDFNKFINKSFNIDKVIEALILIIDDYLKYGIETDERFVVNKTRRALELIIFNKDIPFNGDVHSYIENIEKENKGIGDIIRKRVLND
ncbi:TMEM165/GDT1 family protein [Anaerosalibacter massiliensis]|uniref:GDT1 family protein n=1 Tax=Anaerosalibacter massiliensis TaxID=1347392 RepID=A0A9X2MGY8_9FIRM|nr:TMEM165/GDT1 family protein [Anaerosalibacter massiliensis]MCR2043863.1 TMEM165/GDT1 family protein [Anaerosalibacter massiliensis]